MVGTLSINYNLQLPAKKSYNILNILIKKNIIINMIFINLGYRKIKFYISLHQNQNSMKL